MPCKLLNKIYHSLAKEHPWAEHLTTRLSDFEVKSFKARETKPHGREAGGQKMKLLKLVNVSNWFNLGLEIKIE